MAGQPWRQRSPVFLISSRFSLFSGCATGRWERWISCVRLARFPCARALWAWRAGLGTTTRNLPFTRASSCSFSYFRDLLLGRRRSIWPSLGFSVVMRSKRFMESPRGDERAPETVIRSLNGNYASDIAIFDAREGRKGAFPEYRVRLSAGLGEVQRVRTKTEAHACGREPR